MKPITDIYEPVHSLTKNLQRQADRRLRHLDLTFTEARILMVLYECHGDYTTREELADALKIDRSNVGRAVSKLITKKLIAAEGADDDRRLSYLALTGEGKGLKKMIFEIDADLTALLYSFLSREETESFASLLRRAAAGTE